MDVNQILFDVGVGSGLGLGVVTISACMGRARDSACKRGQELRMQGLRILVDVVDALDATIRPSGPHNVRPGITPEC